MTSTTTAIALPWVVLVSIMSFFALIGNIIVILVIIQDRYLKGLNYTLALVCNMAISDSLYVGLAIPLILASAFTQGNWDLGNAGCKLMMFLPNFCIASSIYTMVFIAHDRRVTILINQPRVHQKSRMYLDPLLVWFLSLIMAAPAFYEYSVYKRPLFSLGDGLGGGSSSEEVDDDLITNTTTFYLACGSHDIVESFEKVYASILFVVAYILPLLIISINYIILGRFIMKRRSVDPIQEVGKNDEKPGYHTGDDIPMQLPNAKAASAPGQGIPMSPFDRVGLQQPDNCSNTALPDEQPVPKGPAEVGKKPETFVKKVSARVIKMLLVLVVTFAISRAPYFIIFVREEITGTDDSARFGEAFHVVKLLASVFMSLLNPLIYAVFNSRIRKGIGRLLCPNVPYFSRNNTTTSDAR